jgi:ABC-type nitrate/sulfonate/bicarbonate transport system substrate-binding protein
MLINRPTYSGMAVTAIVAIVASGSLAGCSAGANAAAGSPAKPIVTTVDSVPASEEGGLYVADHEGFFAPQGLAVKIKPITGGEAGIPDLQSGKADLVAGNYVSFILAQMAGTFDGKPASMRIIAAGSELQPGSEMLYVMPDSRFKTVASLGKYHARVGLNTPSDVGDVAAGAARHDRRAGARRGAPGRLRPGVDAELPLHRLHRHDAVGADPRGHRRRVPAPEPGLIRG